MHQASQENKSNLVWGLFLSSLVTVNMMLLPCMFYSFISCDCEYDVIAMHVALCKSLKYALLSTDLRGKSLCIFHIKLQCNQEVTVVEVYYLFSLVLFPFSLTISSFFPSFFYLSSFFPIFLPLYIFPLPFSSPPFGCSSFLSSFFSLPVSSLLFMFPLFLFPLTHFLLLSYNLFPFSPFSFYGRYFFVSIPYSFYLFILFFRSPL